MRTRNSPPSSEQESNVALSDAAGTKPRCDWSPQDEIDLITFLIKEKVEGRLSDSLSFKSATWTEASRLLEKTHTKGAPKTSKACQEKWTRLRHMSFQ